MADEEALKAAKTERRTAKSALTRGVKSLSQLIDAKRPEEEVRESLNKLQIAFQNLVTKHENYARLIEDDGEFEKEEEWMGECHDNFLSMEIRARMFMDSFSSKGKGPLKINSPKTSEMNEKAEKSDSVPGNDGMQIMQNADGPDNAQIESVVLSDDNPINTQQPPSSGNDKGIVENGSFAGGHENNNNAASASGACGFKMEKPKMPKFAGDVREYAIFRADFKHAIESKYSKRDAITFLRTCLQDKPLELIKGIRSDYDATWGYLDSIYGDPRCVSNTITQDIVKFRALQPGEEARFCDLFHLVKRSFNTLIEVGSQNDMDNSHMSIIEQKNVFRRSKGLVTRSRATGGKSYLGGTYEVDDRMRATAPLRSSSHHRSVNLFQAGEPNKWHKNSSRWPDQCPRFAVLSIDRRIKATKENHVCFSWVKPAGRAHRIDNCQRRQKCTKTENGKECMHFHHPLFHKSTAVKIAVASLSDPQETLLPVITCKIYGQNMFSKQANTLLDSKAQVSLNREDTATTLGLNGKDTVTITKVGG